MLKRYRIDLSYDGTNYAGWQIQPNAITIQQLVEQSIGELTGHTPKVHGSGRTDQGVHARRQVAHFDLNRDVLPMTLKNGLNAKLPPDIRVLSAHRVDLSFHARKSVTEKEYRYFIWNSGIMPPFKRYYWTHIRSHLNCVAMRHAASILEGTHDFTSFSANAKRQVDNAVRTLRRFSVCKRGSAITIIAAGDGFLYRMVRSLAGFLIKVGEGKLASEDASRILASRERTAIVQTAAPNGLFLWNVRYD